MVTQNTQTYKEMIDEGYKKLKWKKENESFFKVLAG